MTDPRYPGVADADGTRAAEGYPPRSAYSAGSDGRRSSGYGYPAGDQGQHSGRSPRADRRAYQPEYADPSGRGGYGGAQGGSGAGGSGAGGSGYPSSSYGAPTTYDPSGNAGYEGGGRSRRGYGTRSDGRGAGSASPASRVASAMRRSVASAARGPRGPRRARLQLKHIDPWSTLKFSLVLSVALFVVWLVAVGILYGVLDGMGVFDKVNGLYEDVTGKDNAQLVGPGLVLGIAALLGAVNIVLFTALATIGSFIYNMCADLVGGVEVTLGEGE